MRFVKGKVLKKAVSALLILCMGFSIPGNSVLAQEEQPELNYEEAGDLKDTDKSPGDQNMNYMTDEQYKDLGFKSLEDPEAFDENDTSNPLQDYSPSILSELYMARGGYDTNYGVSGFLMENAKTYDDLDMSKFVDNKLSSLDNYVYDKKHKDNYKWQYQSSTTVAIKLGDLSTGKYIKDSIIQNSVFLDKTNNNASTEAMVLYTFSDDKYKFEQQCIVKNVLDPNNKFVENIQLQEANGYLAIAVGDYNSDNYNEVAVYVSSTDEPRINLYRQKNVNGKIQLEFFKDIKLSSMSSDFNKCDGCTRPIVSLSTTNISGRDDLVINVSLPYKNKKEFCYDGKTSIYSMAGNVPKEVFSDTGSYSKSGTESYRMKFTSSTTMDIDGNGTKELVIAGNRNTNFNNGSSRGSMDGRNNLVDVILWEDDSYKKAWSEPQEVYSLDFIKKDYEQKDPVAVTGTKMNSTNEKETLFVEGVFFSFKQGDGDSANEQIKNGEFAKMGQFRGDTGTTNAFIHLAVSASFVESDRVAEQTLVIMGDEYSGDHDKLYLDIYWCYYDVARGLQIRCINNDYFTRKDEDDNATLLNFCPVDVDNDTVYMKYKNKSVGWSNPQIYSVMLSTPYWKELEYGSLMGSRGTTSFSVTTGTTNEQTTNWNVGLGGSVSVQFNCTVFGNGGKFGASIDAMRSYVGSYQKSNTKSEALKFDAGGGEDYVALMTVPIAVYHYDVWVPEHIADEEDVENYKQLYPDGKDCPKIGDFIEGTFSEMCVNVQFNPANSCIPVSTYNKVIEEFNRTSGDEYKLKVVDLDSIYRGRDVGDPSTYATDTLSVSSINPKSDKTLVADKSISIGINGKTTLTSTLSEGTSTKETHGFSFSLKTSLEQTFSLGINLMEIINVSGSLTAKENAAFGIGSTWASSNSESLQYTATYAALPASAQTGTTYAGTSDSAYAFMARLVKWVPDDLEKGACVIGSLVEGADGACPGIPKDFYVAQTTNSSATLRWNTNNNYTRKPYGYKVYYSKSPDKDYLPVTEDGKDVVIPFDKESYTVTGLKNGTTYYFKLQSYYDINDKKSASTLGPYAWCITKGSEKEPKITKPPVDLYREIGSDAEFTINASPLEAEDTLHYQWQKLGTVDYYRSDWYDIQDAKSNKFNAAYFAENGVINESNAKDLDRTVYRCNVIEEVNGMKDNYKNISRAAVLYIGKIKHTYNKNGFCMECGNYQPAEYDSSSETYKVKNAGQLFWFASMVNGDAELAEFDKKDEGANCTITHDIDLEGREWKPINNYKGIFDGQGHTISGLKITKTSSKAGLIGSMFGAKIKNFAVKGDIILESEGTYIGGAIGYADGGSGSNIFSYVNISNTGKEQKHVGGVIGSIQAANTYMEKCAYYGEINLSNSVDCIGGIAGYTNKGGQIISSVNMGTVSASEKGAFIGGLLGYVNSGSGAVIDSYNYGKVSNAGDNSKCGAIIGWLRNASPASGNNYYLEGSCSLPFGSDSKPGYKADSKTDAEFASGEVAYLMNGGTINGDQPWYQTIGEDNVPVLDNSRKTVYKVSVQLCPGCETEIEYSNTNKSISGDHNFVNGFCTHCGFYQKAGFKNNIYEISNGGQLFWFASMANGDATLAEFDKKDEGAKCAVKADIDLEGREWKPINNFKGTFDGQNHTIKGLKVTKTSSKAGLFGSISGAVIKDFSLKGDIVLESSGTDNGGIIGYANGGTVLNISSYINISNTGGEQKHVGGIIGAIGEDTTNIEKCVYYGRINLSNTVDCIGGVAAYTNRGTRMSNCANLGTVSASKEGAFIGGIIGKIDGSTDRVMNCYNYGTVSNAGDKSKCGAVIGYSRYYVFGTISNNYYLDSSSSLAFGSINLPAFTAFSKTDAQFASGEVAYLLNGGETGGKQAWYQTIGKDNAPVLDGSHKTVYKVNKQLCPGCKAEAVYSNTNEDICGKHNFVDGVCTYCGLEDKVDAPFDKDENGNFIIKTYDDLVKLAEIVKSDYDIYGDKGYVLANNIIAGKDSVWTAGIGSVSENKPFNGTFNGNGYCIMGLNIDSPEYGGLFEIIGEKGKVQDLFVLKFKYASPCENAGSIAAVNNGTIDHCTNGINVGSAFIFTEPQTKEPIKAQELNSEINGTLSGGIAADNTGLIRGCRNAAIITGTECGGIAGVNTGEIYGCANNGRIGIEGSSTTKTAGGITAKNGGTVTSSYNSEKIYGKSEKTVGSIAGLNGFGTESSPIVKNVFFISVNGITAAGTDSLVKSVDSSNTSKKQSEMREDSFTDALNSVTDDTVRWCRAKSVNKGYPRIESKVFEQVEKKLENGITLKGSMHSSLNISYSLLEEDSDEYNKLVSDINKADNKEIDDIPALTSYGSSLIDINGERKVIKGYSVSLTDSEKNPILAELWIQGDIEISVPVEHEEVTLAGIGSDGSLIECEPESCENGTAVFRLSEPVSFVITDKSGGTDSSVPDDNKTQVNTNTHKGGTIVKTGDLSNVLLWMLAISVSSAAVIILWRRRKVE